MRTLVSLTIAASPEDSGVSSAIIVDVCTISIVAKAASAIANNPAEASKLRSGSSIAKLPVAVSLDGTETESEAIGTQANPGSIDVIS